jgi:ankyrin repeat protein
MAPLRLVGLLLLGALALGGCGPSAQALLAASAKGDTANVKALLGKGAKPGRSVADGTTPLMAAAQHGHLEVARTLVDSGADVNAARGDPERGRTALIDAAWSGYTDIVRLLLEKGANPNAKAESGATALTGASLQGYAEIVNLLIAGKAEINTHASDGRTPLHEAAKNGHGPVVEILLKRGANPNATNEVAALGGYGGFATTLLTWGADVNLESNSGATALRAARSRGHDALVELFREVGAKE